MYSMDKNHKYLPFKLHLSVHYPRVKTHSCQNKFEKEEQS